MRIRQTSLPSSPVSKPRNPSSWEDLLFWPTKQPTRRYALSRPLRVPSHLKAIKGAGRCVRGENPALSGAPWVFSLCRSLSQRTGAAIVCDQLLDDGRFRPPLRNRAANGRFRTMEEAIRGSGANSRELLYLDQERLIAVSYTVNGNRFVAEKSRVRVDCPPLPRRKTYVRIRRHPGTTTSAGLPIINMLQV